MKCPVCKTRKMEKVLFSGVEIDYCPRCYGLWFEEDELRQAKDEKDRDLRWLDIEVWKDEKQFRVSPSGKLCPADRLPLYEVHYGDSAIKIDLCNICHGIWLDRGEFKDIIAYLKEKSAHEVLYHYIENVGEELWEVFSGPEMLKEELADLLVILKILRYKFLVQHPVIAKIVAALPR